MRALEEESEEEKASGKSPASNFKQSENDEHNISNYGATTAAGSSIKQNKYGDSIVKKSKNNKAASFYNQEMDPESMDQEQDAEIVSRGQAYDTQEEIAEEEDVGPDDD